MKSLHIFLILSLMAVISFPMIFFISQNVFGEGQTFHSTLEDQFGNTTQTKLIHNNSILILNQTTPKLTYKMGENITINTELINIGNTTATIGYCEPLVALEIKNQTDDEVWPNSQVGCIPEFTFTKTLRPGEHISIQPWSSQASHTSILSPRLDVSGKYTVVSVALLTFDIKSERLGLIEPLWSKPFQITVTNETIPEFPFVIPVFLASISSLIIFYRIKFR